MSTTFTGLQAQLNLLLTWKAIGPLVVTGQNPSVNQNSIQHALDKLAFGSGLGQVNMLGCEIISAPANSITSFDIKSMYDVVSQNTSANFNYIKVMIIELLNTSQDSTNGTDCPWVAVGQQHANPTASHGPFLATDAMIIPNGGCVVWSGGASFTDGVSVISTGEIIPGTLQIHNQHATGGHGCVRLTVLGIVDG